MLRVVVFAAACASAAAFAPGALPSFGKVRSAKSTAPRMAVFPGSFSESVPFLKQPDALDGSLPGDVGFDPLGFSDVFDIRVLREAELKHGRIAMLATLGLVVQEAYVLPFFEKVLPIPAHDVLVKSGGMSQILLWTSFAEIFGGIALFQTIQGKRDAGDFSFDPLKLSVNDSEKRAKYAVAEIKHARLAMLAFSGMVHQYFITNQGVIEQIQNFKPINGFPDVTFTP